MLHLINVIKVETVHAALHITFLFIVEEVDLAAATFLKANVSGVEGYVGGFNALKSTSEITLRVIEGSSLRFFNKFLVLL